ncbi:hypothetical protein MIND_00105500 [Mycena indigotica]|uniref:DUF7918 domain-containing protein n=1 Tax=Mycena indigotica TaxID=2126181 RepID=A0A8H6TEQ4_9AGAR|nr:uncharacterized protein MIND_00105500 [Mycena indigotica]KAF7315889.1 hypothetical protein MIND_00105500 [Mycena indigotica]
MLDWHNRLRAWISIDGVAAEEYGVEVDEKERTVSCWVGSEVGKSFAINWENRDFIFALGAYAYVDGAAGGGTMYEAGPRKLLPSQMAQEGIIDARGLNPFVFARLNLSDDDTLLAADPAGLADLGVIELRIFRVSSSRESFTMGNITGTLSLPTKNVHERAKKAVTQQVQLGAPQQPLEPPAFRQVDKIGPHLVKFLFKYRPMGGLLSGRSRVPTHLLYTIDVLRANGIAPPLKRKATPSPARAVSPDADPAEADIAQAAATVDRLEKELLAAKALLAKHVDTKPRIKREAVAGSGSSATIDLTGPDRPKKKVKRENGPSEVIDLT